jgi:murein DD-endopeptidase MepM/ murein hydrolase activator NlpD
VRGGGTKRREGWAALYQVNDIGVGSGSGAAALALDGGLYRSPGTRGAFGHNSGGRRARAGEFDLVVDLGQRIGSREWLRGFVTCFGLCYAAWSLAPGIQPLPGASPAPLADAQFEEARTLGIAPLAYGADTGRRMAPTDAVEALAESPERPVVDLRATLGRGDGFAAMLERAGVAAAEAARVAAMIGGIVPLADIRPGTVMDLTLGRRPNRTVARPLDKLTFRARFDLRVELARVAGALTLTRIPIAVDDTPLRIQGLVGASLYRSARAAGAPARAVEAYIRALNTQLNVPAGINSSDRFDIIIEHRRAATGETQMGALLYAGLNRASGRDLQMMQWESDGRSQWFEASGIGRQSGGMTRPVPGGVSSGFGMRFHPILNYSRMHRGVDLRASYGTPIVAVSDGRVELAGWHGGHGNTVELNHGGGMETMYGHMSRIAVRAGERVRRGAVIGYVGSTGLSTGPHLHFEVHRNGVPVNPLGATFASRAQLSAGELASFRSRLRGLLGTPVGAAQRAPQPSAGAGAIRTAR